MIRPVTIDVQDGRVRLAGELIFDGTPSDLMDAIEIGSRTGRAELLVTPNVDQVLELQDNSAFRDVYSTATIRVLDGMPLVAFARIRGAKSVQRHTGADLLPAIAAESHARQWRIAVTGGDPRIATDAVAALGATNPGAHITAVPFPMITSVADVASHQVVATLTELRPDIVFLCLGAPKQELWFGHWRDSLPPALYIGAGAAVDFAAGRVRRAPTWVQRVGMEWSWRLLGEPKRLAGRYLVRGPRVLAVFARSWRAARHG